MIFFSVFSSSVGDIFIRALICDCRCYRIQFSMMAGNLFRMQSGPRMLMGALLITLVGLGFFYWRVSRSKTELEAKHEALKTQHDALVEQHGRVSRTLGVTQNDLNNERKQRESDKTSHSKELERLREESRVEGEKMQKEATEVCEGKLKMQTDRVAMLEKKNWEIIQAMDESKATGESLKKEKVCFFCLSLWLSVSLSVDTM